MHVHTQERERENQDKHAADAAVAADAAAHAAAADAAVAANAAVAAVFVYSDLEYYSILYYCLHMCIQQFNNSKNSGARQVLANFINLMERDGVE